MIFFFINLFNFTPETCSLKFLSLYCWEVNDAIPLEVDDFALIDSDRADNGHADVGNARREDAGRRTGRSIQEKS